MNEKEKSKTDLLFKIAITVVLIILPLYLIYFSVNIFLTKTTTVNKTCKAETAALYYAAKLHLKDPYVDCGNKYLNVKNCSLSYISNTERDNRTVIELQCSEYCDSNYCSLKSD